MVGGAAPNARNSTTVAGEKPSGPADSAGSGGAPLHHVRFEIHGKVQGVFFRSHTEREAKRLGLVGYVLNTTRSTVLGEACGPLDKLEEFKHWLSTKGSPKSRITKAVFTEEAPAAGCKFVDFVVRR